MPPLKEAKPSPHLSPHLARASPCGTPEHILPPLTLPLFPLQVVPREACPDILCPEGGALSLQPGFPGLPGTVLDGLRIGPWAGSKQTPLGSEAERKWALLCQDIGWILKLAFPPLLFSVREPSAREAAPTTPTPVSPPSQLSTIHLPRARNVAPGHCGACSQSPSSSFHSGFYRLASIPQSAVWI